MDYSGLMIKIGHRSIGNEAPCFVIAEAGVNHNGDIKLAFQLIDVAAAAGADAIKFQTFTAANLVTQKAGMADYQKANTGLDQSQYEMLKALELSQDDFAELKIYAEEKDMVFISTPFDDDAVTLLENIGVELYKVGSGDLTNLPLISKLAALQKPIILSTGMANMEEIHEAVSAVTAYGTEPIVLHCTSNYPTSDDEVNLSAMNQIKRQTNCIVGYSDHTISIDIPALAVASGAKVIEKHITLDKAMAGPDHKASIEPIELESLIKKIRWVEKIMGDGAKTPTRSEALTALVARKSLVAGKEIKKGEVLTAGHLAIKRPGSGLKPKYYQDFIGKKATRDIGTEEILTWEDIQ